MARLLAERGDRAALLGEPPGVDEHETPCTDPADAVLPVTCDSGLVGHQRAALMVARASASVTHL